MKLTNKNNDLLLNQLSAAKFEKVFILWFLRDLSDKCVLEIKAFEVVILCMISSVMISSSLGQRS